MTELKLTAKTDFEKIILEYLQANASDALAKKINGGKKTLNGFFNYAREQARSSAKNGVACIEDKIVFGWAIHYFEEDSIKENAKPESKPAEKPKNGSKTAKQVTPDKLPDSKPKKKQAANNTAQMSLFDSLFTGGEV